MTWLRVSEENWEEPYGIIGHAFENEHRRSKVVQEYVLFFHSFRRCVIEVDFCCAPVLHCWLQKSAFPRFSQFRRYRGHAIRSPSWRFAKERNTMGVYIGINILVFFLFVVIQFFICTKKWSSHVVRDNHRLGFAFVGYGVVVKVPDFGGMGS